MLMSRWKRLETKENINSLLLVIYIDDIISMLLFIQFDSIVFVYRINECLHYTMCSVVQYRYQHHQNNRSANDDHGGEYRYACGIGQLESIGR